MSLLECLQFRIMSWISIALFAVFGLNSYLLYVYGYGN